MLHNHLPGNFENFRRVIESRNPNPKVLPIKIIKGSNAPNNYMRLTNSGQGAMFSKRLVN